MVFPSGSKVNSIGTCNLWSTEKPWSFKRLCSNSVVGEGWALVALGGSALGRMSVDSGGTAAPSGTGNYSDAPADCLPNETRAPGTLNVLDPGYSGAVDATSYSRTFEGGVTFSNPLAGLSCTPQGRVWVHVFAYAGSGTGKVDANGYVFDMNDAAKAPVLKQDGTAFKKDDVYPVTVTSGKLTGKGLVAGGKLTKAQVTAITGVASKLLTSKTAIIFANDNGVAALSFGGTTTPTAGGTLTLHVDLPAFNSAGLKGYLPLDSDLMDFRLVVNNSKYITAGACPSSKMVDVVTTVTYNPFPGDYASGNTTKYADKVIHSPNACS
jgi:hypothetical protein